MSDTARECYATLYAALQDTSLDPGYESTPAGGRTPTAIPGLSVKPFDESLGWKVAEGHTTDPQVVARMFQRAQARGYQMHVHQIQTGPRAPMRHRITLYTPRGGKLAASATGQPQFYDQDLAPDQTAPVVDSYAAEQPAGPQSAYGQFANAQELTKHLETEYADHLQLLDIQEPHGKSVHLSQIEMKPGARGQGVGSKIIRAIQEYATARDLPITLEAQAEPRKKAALEAFYRTHGFQRPGRTRDYSLPRHTHIWRPRFGMTEDYSQAESPDQYAAQSDQSPAFSAKFWENLRSATDKSPAGSIGGILENKALRRQFRAIHNVGISVNPELPDDQPARALIRTLTPQQQTAGVPIAHIEIRPDATPEHLFHEMIHADRAAKGRPVSGQSWPAEDEHSALVGGQRLAGRYQQSITDAFLDCYAARHLKSSPGQQTLDFDAPPSPYPMSPKETQAATAADAAHREDMTRALDRPRDEMLAMRDQRRTREAQNRDMVAPTEQPAPTPAAPPTPKRPKREWTPITLENGRKAYRDEHGTVWTHAIEHGEVSPVTGTPFAKGSFMPIHGLAQKVPKVKATGQDAAEQAKPNENAKQRESRPVRQMSPEDIERERIRREEIRKWDEINTGPLGRVKWLGEKPNQKAIGQSGTNLKGWHEYAEQLGPEGMRRLVATLEPMVHGAIDHETALTKADPRAMSNFAAMNARQNTTRFDPDESGQWAKDEIRRRAEENAQYTHGAKKHLRAVPDSYYGRELLEEALGQNASVDGFHRLHKILADAATPPSQQLYSALWAACFDHDQYARKYKPQSGQRSLWDEDQHPRGQPENSGEFASKDAPVGKVSDAPVSQKTPTKTPENPHETPTGAEAVATRMEQARQRFIDNAVEQFGVTPEEAASALDQYRKHKLVTMDAVNGTYNLKHGDLWDAKTIRGAAKASNQPQNQPAKSSPGARKQSPSSQQPTLSASAGARKILPGYEDRIADAKQRARNAINAEYASPRERADAIEKAKLEIADLQAEARTGRPAHDTDAPGTTGSRPGGSNALTGEEAARQEADALGRHSGTVHGITGTLDDWHRAAQVEPVRGGYRVTVVMGKPPTASSFRVQASNERQAVAHAFKAHQDEIQGNQQTDQAGADFARKAREQQQAMRAMAAASNPDTPGQNPDTPPAQNVGRSAEVPTNQDIGGQEAAPTYKRANPPQVAAPMPHNRNVSFVTATRGEQARGTEYIIPGFEEYRVVIVPPRGSKSKHTKRGWEAYEATSGLTIMPDRFATTDEASTAAKVKELLQRVGKQGVDQAIEATIKELAERRKESEPQQFTSLSHALTREFYAQAFAQQVVDQYAQQRTLFDADPPPPRKDFDPAQHPKESASGGQFVRKFPRVLSKEVQPALPGVDLPAQQRLVTKKRAVGQGTSGFPVPPPTYPVGHQFYVAPGVSNGGAHERVPVRIHKLDDTHAHIGWGDSPELNYKSDGHVLAKIPRESLEQFVNDLQGKVAVPATHRDPRINMVASGQARFLGKGDDGLAFDTGDHVVKVSTVVPYHWTNYHGTYTPEQAAKTFRDKVSLNNEMLDQGVPGLLRQGFFHHGGKGFATMPKLELPSRFEQQHIDQMRETLDAMHERGYVLRDDVQAGVGKDGRAYMFDTGKARKLSELDPAGKWHKEEIKTDRDHLKRLADQHDLENPWAKDDALEAYNSWDNAMIRKTQQIKDGTLTPQQARLWLERGQKAWQNMLAQDPEQEQWWQIPHQENMELLHGVADQEPTKPQTELFAALWNATYALDRYAGTADQATVVHSHGTPEYTANKQAWHAGSHAITKDHDGTPKRLFHGTNAPEFNAFAPERLGKSTKARTALLGHFSTDRTETSNMFAHGEGGHVHPVHVFMKKPFIVDDFDDNYLTNLQRAPTGGMEFRNFRKRTAKPELEPFNQLQGFIANVAKKPSWKDVTSEDVVAFREHLKSRGYDGIVVRKTVMDAGTNVPTELQGRAHPTSDQYIVFDPTQIKSATANRGTWDRANARMDYDQDGNSPTQDIGGALYAALWHASLGLDHYAVRSDPRQQSLFGQGGPGQGESLQVQTNRNQLGVSVNTTASASADMAQLPDIRQPGSLAASLPPPDSAILPPHQQKRHGDLLRKGFRRTQSEQQEFEGLGRQATETNELAWHPDVQTGIDAWASGQVYIDKSGNYRWSAKSNAVPTYQWNKVVPFNTALKSAFPDSLALHNEANRQGKTNASTRMRPPSGRKPGDDTPPEPTTSRQAELFSALWNASLGLDRYAQLSPHSESVSTHAAPQPQAAKPAQPEAYEQEVGAPAVDLRNAVPPPELPGLSERQRARHQQLVRKLYRTPEEHQEMQALKRRSEDYQDRQSQQYAAKQPAQDPNTHLFFHATDPASARALPQEGIKPDALNRRDAGFFGPGFYASRAPQNFYGRSLVAIHLKPDARVLEVGDLVPKAPAAWHQDFLDSYKRRILKHRPNMEPARLQKILDGVTPGHPTFDHLSYKNEVGSYARSEGFDASTFANGQETVIHHPDAVAHMQHVGGLKAATAYRDKHEAARKAAQAKLDTPESYAQQFSDALLDRYRKDQEGQQHLWTETDEAKHPRDQAGLWIDAEKHEESYQTKKGETKVRAKWKLPGGQDLPEYVTEVPPPSLTNVQIASHPRHKYQFQGLDAKGRNQKRRAPWFAAQQDARKWARVARLRQQLSTALESSRANRQQDPEAADVFHLVATMGLRPGSDKDTGAEHKGYGATTLLGQHVVQDQDGKVRLAFVPGKKHGQMIELPVDDSALAQMLLERSQRAGQEGRLFATNEQRLRQHVKQHVGKEIKAKDLRTALGTMTAEREVAKIIEAGQFPTNAKAYSQVVRRVCETVAGVLGNTHKVAHDSYIDPAIWKPLQSHYQPEQTSHASTEPDPGPVRHTARAAGLDRRTQRVGPRGGEPGGRGRPAQRIHLGGDRRELGGRVARELYCALAGFTLDRYKKYKDSPGQRTMDFEGGPKHGHDVSDEARDEGGQWTTGGQVHAPEQSGDVSPQPERRVSDPHHETPASDREVSPHGENERLAAAAQSGDREAAGLLWQRNQGLIVNLARRYVKQSADVDDAVQDLYLKVFLPVLRRFDPDKAQFDTYLGQSIKNHFIKRWRRQQGRPAELQGAEDQEGRAIEEPATEPGTDPLELDERARAIRTALDRAPLSPREREVVEATYGIDRPAELQARIGERMSLNPRSVSVILRRALDKLTETSQKDLKAHYQAGIQQAFLERYNALAAWDPNDERMDYEQQGEAPVNYVQAFADAYRDRYAELPGVLATTGSKIAGAVKRGIGELTGQKPEPVPPQGQLKFAVPHSALWMLQQGHQTPAIDRARHTLGTLYHDDHLHGIAKQLAGQWANQAAPRSGPGRPRWDKAFQEHLGRAREVVHQNLKAQLPDLLDAATREHAHHMTRYQQTLRYAHQQNARAKQLGPQHPDHQDLLAHLWQLHDVLRDHKTKVHGALGDLQRWAANVPDPAPWSPPAAETPKASGRAEAQQARQAERDHRQRVKELQRAGIPVKGPTGDPIEDAREPAHQAEVAKLYRESQDAIQGARRSAKPAPAPANPLDQYRTAVELATTPETLDREIERQAAQEIKRRMTNPRAKDPFARMTKLSIRDEVAKRLTGEARQRAVQLGQQARDWHLANNQPTDELDALDQRLATPEPKKPALAVQPVMRDQAGNVKPVTEKSLARQEAAKEKREEKPAQRLPVERQKTRAQEAKEQNEAMAQEYGWTPKEYDRRAQEIWNDRVNRATQLRNLQRSIRLNASERRGAAQGQDVDAIKGFDLLDHAAGEHGLEDMDENRLYELATGPEVRIPGPHEPEWHQEVVDQLRQQGIVPFSDRQAEREPGMDEEEPPDPAGDDEPVPFTARRQNLAQDLYSALWWASVDHCNA